MRSVYAFTVGFIGCTAGMIFSYFAHGAFLLTNERGIMAKSSWIRARDMVPDPIRLSGTIRSVDHDSQTITLDIINPYARETTIPIHIDLGERMIIVNAAKSKVVESEKIQAGTYATVSIFRKTDPFKTHRIELFDSAI